MERITGADVSPSSAGAALEIASNGDSGIAGAGTGTGGAAGGTGTTVGTAGASVG